MKKYERDLPPFTEEEKEAYRLRFKHGLFRQLRALFRKRSAEGLTQKAIAARLSSDEASISRRLRGETNLTLATLCDLARAMDARIETTVRPLEEVRPIQSTETATVDLENDSSQNWERVFTRALCPEAHDLRLRAYAGKKGQGLPLVQIVSTEQGGLTLERTLTAASSDADILMDKSICFGNRRTLDSEVVR